MNGLDKIMLALGISATVSMIIGYELNIDPLFYISLGTFGGTIAYTYKIPEDSKKNYTEKI